MFDLDSVSQSHVSVVFLALGVFGLFAAACSESQPSATDGQSLDSPVATSELVSGDNPGGLDEYTFPEEVRDDGCTEDVTHFRIVENTAVFGCGDDEIFGFDLDSNEVSWSYIPGETEVDVSLSPVGVAGEKLGLVIEEEKEPEGLEARTIKVQFVTLDVTTGDEISRQPIFDGNVGDQSVLIDGGISRESEVFVVGVSTPEGDIVSGFDTNDGTQIWTHRTDGYGIETMGSVYSVVASASEDSKAFDDGVFFDARTNEPIVEMEEGFNGLPEYGNTVVLDYNPFTGKGSAIFSVESGQSVEVDYGLIFPYIDGFFYLDDAGSLSFREVTGETRWATDPGVVQRVEFLSLGDGPAWMVASNQADERFAVDPESGQPVTAIDPETEYYGNWTVRNTEKQFVAQRR